MAGRRHHLRAGTILAAVAVLALGAPAARGSSHDVDVADNSFAPSSLTVDVGTTVRWEQSGVNNHSVTSQDGAWDSHPNCPPVCMRQGDFYEFTFLEPGQYEYFCKVHGTAMSGTIVVQEDEPSPSPTQTQTVTPSPSPTRTRTPSPSPTETAESPSPSPSPSPSESPSESPSPSPTETLTDEPTPTDTPDDLAAAPAATTDSGSKALIAGLAILMLGGVGVLVWRRYLGAP